MKDAAEAKRLAAKDESQGAAAPPAAPTEGAWTPPGSDAPFYAGFAFLGAMYVLLIVAMLAADIAFAWSRAPEVLHSLLSPEIRYALWLSLLSSTITAILALWVAIPIGYLLSRFEFPGKAWLDAVLDIPIFLPPLVVGLSLLILFRQTPLRALDDALPVALAIPGVILAQFAVAAAFAVRAMRATFDEVPTRHEDVALTLGCSRWQAFCYVALPASWRGLITAATLAWARAFGEFGPILVFAGSTRFKTEVLPVSVHLELSVGNTEGAVGVSLLMVVVALLVLGVVRSVGGGPAWRGFEK